MQEKTWLKPLPKMEKELELIKLCVEVLQTCAMLPKSPMQSETITYAENIMYRYMKQLEILTRPNETRSEPEFELNP